MMILMLDCVDRSCSGRSSVSNRMIQQRLKGGYGVMPEAIGKHLTGVHSDGRRLVLQPTPCSFYYTGNDSGFFA